MAKGTYYSRALSHKTLPSYRHLVQLKFTPIAVSVLNRLHRAGAAVRDGKTSALMPVLVPLAAASMYTVGTRVCGSWLKA